jgi:predicted glycosyltransferase
LFFAPIARHLSTRGDDVLVTARRFAQTAELAGRLFDDPVVMGSGSRASLAGKVTNLGDRVRSLIPVVRRFGPDVAVSHGSYDQPIVSRILGVPQLSMVDYEHHPGTHLLFRLATRLLLPTAFSSELVLSHGGRRKTWRYRGLKEEVYLTGFAASPSQRVDLGIAEHHGPVVTVRPPAVGALYHRHENPLWVALIDRLRSQPEVLALVLPRHPSQVAELTSILAAPHVRVLDHVVDGPALVWWSDAVISAGGTMNREAVAMGTPVWSVFSGKLGAVDAALIAQGRMRRLESPDDVSHVEIRSRQRRGNPRFTNDVLGQVIQAIDRTAVVPIHRRLRPRTMRVEHTA